MIFYYWRDEICNKLIVWLMNHCHCYATVFYTACKRYYPKEVKCMYQSWADFVGLE